MGVKGIVYSVFVLVMFGLSPNLEAQECDEDIDEKAIKLCEKGKDKKKYNKIKRMEYLRAAIEEEEDYAEANYILGTEVIKTALSKGTGFSTALKYFEKTASLCPNYHSNMYYFLGAIYYGKTDYIKAEKYQKLFLGFESDDASKFSKKYEKYLEETTNNLKVSTFHAFWINNPVPFNPQVVRDVSTNEAEEFLPLISPDNELLLFTRKWEESQRSGATEFGSHVIEKLTMAKLTDGNFDKGKPMPAPFNVSKKSNYGGATLSLNNRHMYLTICTPYQDKDYSIRKNCDIYRSNYEFGLNKITNAEEYYWTEPENLGPNINTSDGWESQPSLSSDGKHLYFASAREGSAGIDIYMSEMNKDGEWGQARALDSTINTQKNDKAPFIHTDSRTLYFASQGHQGFGAYDVYFARQNEDGTWTKPKNVGSPINTDEDEHGFIVSADGQKAYYSSNHIKNKRTVLNVLSFDLYKEARPDKVVMVKGNVKEKGVSAENKHVTLKNITSKKVSQFDVEQDGTFAAVMVVNPGDKVIMKVEGDNVAYNARVIELPEEEEEEEEEEETKTSASIELKPIAQKIDVVIDEEKIGGSYKLEDIHYETNSAEFSERSRIILNDFAEYLMKNSNIKIAIHGHTDNVGSSSDNIALSTDRAFSIKTYLQEKGIDGNRLYFMGFGDKKPVENNSTEEGRKQNRRTEFAILSK